MWSWAWTSSWEFLLHYTENKGHIYLYYWCFGGEGGMEGLISNRYFASLKKQTNMGVKNYRATIWKWIHNLQYVIKSTNWKNLVCLLACVHKCLKCKRLNFNNIFINTSVIPNEIQCWGKKGAFWTHKLNFNIWTKTLFFENLKLSS